MTTKTQLDNNRRRVLVTVALKPQTETVAETVLRLLAGRPELGGWDWIFDIRNPHAQATADELDQIAAAFNARTSKQAYTVFVSRDPGTYDRCALLGAKFHHRCHLVARDVAEAETLLPQTMQFI